MVKEFYIKAKNRAGHWFYYMGNETWSRDIKDAELVPFQFNREQATQKMMMCHWIYGIEIRCVGEDK